MSVIKKILTFSFLLIASMFIVGSLTQKVNAALSDSYENNDSVKKAYDLSFSDPIGVTDWSNEVHAHIRKYNIFDGRDNDYFMIYVYGNGSLNVNLSNIPSGVNYDLEVLKHDDYKFVKDTDYKLIASSKQTLNTVENININVTPGTYYIRVYPNSNSDWNNTTNYKLKINYIMDAYSASIQDLKFRNAKAAVWVSDYKPFGLNAVDLSGNTVVGLYNGIYDAGYLTVRHGNTFHQKISLYSPIVYTKLFVWDTQWRNEIKNILNQMGTFLQNQVVSMERIQSSIEFISGGFSLIFTAVGAGGVVKTLTIKILENLNSGLASLIPLIFPQSWYATKWEVIAYLGSLAAAFETGVGTPSNEVVSMRLRYQINIEEAYTGSRSYSRTYKLSFVPVMVFQDHIYNYDHISHYQHEGAMSGRVYGLRNFSDLENFIKGTPITNLPNPTTGGSGGGSGGGGGGFWFEEMN